ncbi:MAG: lipid-binding SYLF domain-containing protein [Planctomycetota bacterium]|jgi:lipid-binding SYLF domain-containing protein
MNKKLLLMLLVLLAAFIGGCSRAKGETFAEKRAYALEMRNTTITELYEKEPITREKIANSSGYGVFSNVNINLFLLSSGNGYGVLRDNATGEDIYMRMQMLGAGLGLGAKDFRAVIIFKTPESLETFATKGWEWGGHADATAKSEDKGGEIGAAGDITSDMEIYQFTEAGIALQATLAGTKYWKDKDLN